MCEVRRQKMLPLAHLPGSFSNNNGQNYLLPVENRIDISYEHGAGITSSRLELQVRLEQKLSSPRTV